MAEERRVKDSYKYQLMPRRTPWSDDNNSFGKLMLEKMGWKPGGGLGANLQGMKNIVPIRRNLDNKGMGYKYNDPYCVHQTSFESVLSDLNNKDDEKPDEEVTLENSRITSLELKSLQSRSRVHYQKFTRGKDISKYSSKDLECILGKKVKKEEPSSKFGFGGSSVDYFKNKLKSNSNIELSSSHNCQTVDVVKLESGEHGLGFGSMQEIECVEKEEYETKEKKKEKRLRRVLNEEVESFGGNCKVIENIDTVKKKKKYRVKENIRFEEQDTSVNDDDTVIIDENLKDSSIHKKNKRKDKKMLKKYSENSEINLKQQDTSMIDYKALIIDENIEESTISPKRKMKRKNTEESEIIVRTHFVEDEEMADNTENNKEIKSGKKKKRKQLKSECSEDLEGTSNIAEERKKMKVEIIGEDVMISQGTACDHLEIIEIHNKKKKHKGNGDIQTCVQESSGNKRKNKNRHSDGHVGILVEYELPSNGEIDHRKKKKRNSKVTKETLAEEFDEQNTTTIEETFSNIGDVQIYKRKRKTLEENHDDTSKSDHNETKTYNSTEHINGKPERRKSVTFSDNLEETFCFNANEKVASNEFDLDDDGGCLGSEANEVVVAKGKKKKRHVKEVEATENIKQCDKNNETKVYDKKKKHVREVEATEDIKQWDKNNENQVYDKKKKKHIKEVEVTEDVKQCDENNENQVHKKKKKKHVRGVEATEAVKQFDKNNETQVYEKKKKKCVKEVEVTKDIKQCDNNNESKVYDKKKKKHVREVKETEDIEQCDKNNETQVYDMVSIKRYFANRPCMDMSNFDFGFKGSNLGTIKGYGNWSDDVDGDEPLHLNTNDKVATVENHSILEGDSSASEANKDIMAKKEKNDAQVEVPIQEWKDWCKYDRIHDNLDHDRIIILHYLSSSLDIDISRLDFGFTGSNIGAIRGYGNWSDTDEDETEE